MLGIRPNPTRPIKGHDLRHESDALASKRRNASSYSCSKCLGNFLVPKGVFTIRSLGVRGEGVNSILDRHVPTPCPID